MFSLNVRHPDLEILRLQTILCTLLFLPRVPLLPAFPLLFSYTCSKARERAAAHERAREELAHLEIRKEKKHGLA